MEKMTQMHTEDELEIKNADAEPLQEENLPPLVYEPGFLDRWKGSRFLLIKVSYYILASIWTIVMVVGGFIAWLIAFLFI